MDKGQQQWDKLVDMPNSYEENPSIAQRAQAEIAQQEKPVKRNWFFRQWKGLVACALSVVVLLCVGIPLLNKLSTPQIVYYEQSDIFYEKVEDANSYVAEKDLDIRYFKNAAKIDTRVALILDTQKVAFLEQDTTHIDMDNGLFDEVILRSVVKKNAQFNFYKSYQILESVHTIRDVKVQYQLFENTDANAYQIFAKFSYQNADYFLEITTEGDGVQQLEKYVNMLLG